MLKNFITICCVAVMLLFTVTVSARVTQITIINNIDVEEKIVGPLEKWTMMHIRFLHPYQLTGNGISAELIVAPGQTRSFDSSSWTEDVVGLSMTGADGIGGEPWGNGINLTKDEETATVTITRFLGEYIVIYE